MANVRLLWLALIGLVLPATALADDALHPIPADSSPSSLTLSIDELLEATGADSSWGAGLPVDEAAYADDWTRAMSDVQFRDSGPLARVSKLRSLSLLTLAENGQSRLYLGINDEGLIGLHFGAWAANADERQLELARMPYLEDDEPGLD